MERLALKACCINLSDLEGTVADHETRLTATEENIQGKNNCPKSNIFENSWIVQLWNLSDNTENYKTVDNVQTVLLSGLQMTDVDLDERVRGLEENSGGDNQNGRKQYLLFGVGMFFIEVKIKYRDYKILFARKIAHFTLKPRKLWSIFCMQFTNYIYYTLKWIGLFNIFFMVNVDTIGFFVMNPILSDLAILCKW